MSGAGAPPIRFCFDPISPYAYLAWQWVRPVAAAHGRAVEPVPILFAAVGRFGTDRLGKGIVVGKDTPNFVANRIGVFSMMHAVHLMKASGLTIADVDALTGPLIGRPRSASFRTADVVGLDTLVYVADNLAGRLPDDPGRDTILPPDFMRTMVDRGLLGAKSG